MTPPARIGSNRAEGLIHRDIKPAKIKLLEGGRRR